MAKDGLLAPDPVGEFLRGKNVCQGMLEPAIAAPLGIHHVERAGVDARFLECDTHPDCALVREAGIVSAGRLAAGDIATLQAAGIRHVIDLTPDAETPDFDEATAVRDAGLAYANLPLAGASDLTRDNVQAFDTMMREAEHPLLVHCGSGNRVGAMAALRAGWIDGQPVEQAIATGRQWGLTGLEEEVRQLIEAGDRPPPG